MIILCDECGDAADGSDGGPSRADADAWLVRYSLLLGAVPDEAKRAIEKMIEDLWGDE
jgi:hypothetical protein